jgi:hypothetical protein
MNLKSDQSERSPRGEEPQPLSPEAEKRVHAAIEFMVSEYKRVGYVQKDDDANPPIEEPRPEWGIPVTRKWLKEQGEPAGEPGALVKPRCVCEVEDGLVQEWVSKAREVAKSKGYDVPKVASLSTSPLQHRIDEWATAKYALDYARPDFTDKQLRDLQAQEAMLLALSATPQGAGGPSVD